MTTPPSKKTVNDDSDHPQEQPQRSRNARAQARHRAKRKAYIEQLEETVTKLQGALNLPPEQVAALPTAHVRIRELEQENMRLRNEINSLRMQLEQQFARNSQSARRDLLPLTVDDNANDRDGKKRRRLSGDVENVYLTPGGTPTHVSSSLSRPPPLSLPHPGHQQSYNHSLSSHGTNGVSSLGSSNSLFPIHATSFQGPGTPTASSSASTPSYSASNNPLPPLEPARGKPHRANSVDPSDVVRSIPHQHQHSNQPSLNHSSSNSHSHMHLPPPVSSHFHHVLPSPFPQSSHYEVVPKAEEDYPLTNHESPPNGNFPPSMHSFGSSEHETSNWHVYSAERAQIHHQ